jgi:hypothetical protein
VGRERKGGTEEEERKGTERGREGGKEAGEEAKRTDRRERQYRSVTEIHTKMLRKDANHGAITTLTRQINSPNVP